MAALAITMAELQQRLKGPQSLKYSSPGPSQKSLGTPALDYSKD